MPILSALRRHKITSMLLIMEIALTCAIVCNAVFLITLRIERVHTPSGIAEKELTVVRLAAVGESGDEYARVQADMAALRQIAGVEQVASVGQVPFGGSSQNTGIKLDPDQKLPTASTTVYYGENILNTLGLKLVEGRALMPEEVVDLRSVSEALKNNDLKAMPHVAVITKALAQRLWPGGHALGKTFYLSGGAPLQVVGIVEDLVRPRIFEFSEGHFSIMLPIRLPQNYYVLRCAPGDRDRVLSQALKRLKDLNPDRVVLIKQPWETFREHYFEDDRAMAGLLAGVCVALLVVTSLGIVGLGSFWVAQRQRQIGVRRALGATRAQILRYFQVENFLLATMGIALGMVLAYAINLFLMVRYELPHLPGFYLPVGALALWLVGQLAVLGPARRAAAVPPVVATRAT